MTKFTATFMSGRQITKTTADGFRNRLDFYNWICENRLGKTYGKVKEITCSAFGKESDGGKKG